MKIKLWLNQVEEEKNKRKEKDNATLWKDKEIVWKSQFTGVPNVY